MFLIDSHAHLDDPQYANDINEVIQRARENNVQYILSIAQDEKSSHKTLEIVNEHQGIFATVGVHPHEAKTATNQTYGLLENLTQKSKVVAIGEIGLDYHYDYSPRETQKNVFRNLMSMADKKKLPVVIHCREAEVDVLSILEEFRNRVIGVMHCFSGNFELMEKCLDLGYFISIAGPVTFKKATELQNLVKNIPLNRLLIETDCPYLTPTPYRGKRNEPSYVFYIAEKIAELRNMNIDELVSHTTRNTKQLFDLPILDDKAGIG